ncbi:MAG: filamentous hemagglutinin N-terminal domain-containing protein [Cyanobacteria bacterium J06635_10]
MINQTPGLKFILACCFLAINNTQTIAQITPDNTLGAESSRVVPNGGIDKIDGGALRDRNLFHSFKEFNINNGQRVYFNNPSGIENILTRVTGGNASNILGTLGVDGAANLFLINPNGIVFGENARLDVNGSFVGSTANGLQFGEQGNFSATNPQAPGLLTVNPSALFFNQLQANGGIINKSQAPAGINPNGDETTGLRVPDGKSLLFVGGDINLDGGSLRAYEGNIELASVAAPGTIGLDISGDTFRLNVPEDVGRGDISLANGSNLSVFGAGGGEFVINARNLEISNSFIFAGIGENSENPDAQAGDVNLNATGSIELKNDAGIDNSVYSQGNAGDIFLQASNSVSLVDSIIANNIEAGGVGKGGNININSGSLSLLDGSEIQAILRDADVENNLSGGQGNVGNININVRDAITIAGIKDGFSNDISNFVGIGAVGNAGDININTGSLSLTEGSEINARTSGQGNAGNITVNARQNISLDGSGDVILIDGSNGTLFTRIISSVNPEAVGNAGDIQLNTGNLSATNGAFISSGINGKGDGGNITINARDTVTFDTGGSAVSSIFIGAVGKGGDIRLTTGTLSLTNGGELSTNVSGEGNPGNIFVEARDNVVFDGVQPTERNGTSFNRISGIQSSLLTGGVGKGGDIQIITGLLSVTNGAIIFATTDGQGDAGNITIDARSRVNFDGFDRNSGFLSEVSTTGGSNSIGNSGDIRITTGELLLKNGGRISSDNFGKGNSGNIFLDVGNTIIFDGVGSSPNLPSSARVTVFNGNAGNIEVNTGSLFLTNGGTMDAGGFPEENSNDIANAGNIIINARDRIEFDGENSGLSTFLSRGVGKGGDIQVTTGSLSVSNRATLFATTSGQGNAGNIKITARDTVTFDRESFAGTAVFSSGIGNSGDIEITTGSLFLSNAGLLIAATEGKGDAGKITINSNNLNAVNGGQINTSTFSSGNAGNIILNVKDRINLSGTGQTFRSGLFASASADSTGKGGSIFIDPRLVIIENGASVSVGSNGTGDAGDIFLEAGTLQLDNGFITAQTATTQGGDINLQLGELLSLRNGSQITTTAGNQQFGGNGGNIDIDTPVIVAIPQENSDITANAFSGNGGNIDISTEGIFGIGFQEESTPESGITASSEFGLDGNVEINTPDIDPSKGLIELPDNIIDNSDQVYIACVPGSPEFENTFISVGTGGIPISPLELLQESSIITNWVSLPQTQTTENRRIKLPSRKVVATNRIVEATGWIVDKDGNIEFVAQGNHISSKNPRHSPSLCSVSK